MSLAFDPAIEQRIQRQLERGSYSDPTEVINRALDLLEAQEVAEDWLFRNKDAINQRLDESFAAAARGESYSLEDAQRILAERRAARAA